MKTTDGTEIFHYSENGADMLKVIALNAMSTNQGNLIFINTVRQNIVVMSFTFLGSGYIKLSQKYFIRPEFTASQFLAATLLPSGDFFYGGTLSTLARPPSSAGIPISPPCLSVSPGASSAVIGSSN